jgi:hypothetical protein
VETTVRVRAGESLRRALARRQSSRLLAAVAGALITVALGGCTEERPLENDRSLPQPLSTPSSPCAVSGDGPELPTWEINETLPIEGVDISYVARSRLVEAGGGPCAEGPADAVVDECLVVSGPYESASDVQLWRPAEAFAEQEIAAGARRIVSEDLTGHTLDDETFHWRAIAVEYPDPAAVRTSPAWGVIDACEDLRSGRLRDGDVSLWEGDEPFLAATIDASTLYIVETWIPTDDIAALDDTESGLPPADAVSAILTWFMDHANDSLPTTTP